ncbi:MAG: hypothetical protein ACTSRA_07230 [Promethearchaeota archaeon]
MKKAHQLTKILILLLITSPNIYHAVLHASRSVLITGRVKPVILFDILVVIYPNTVGGSLSPEEHEILRDELEEARLFFWRNTFLTVDLSFHYLVIDACLPLSRFSLTSWGGYWLPPYDVNTSDNTFVSVEMDLRNQGIMDDEFDGVLVFYAWGGNGLPAAYGGTTFGVDLGFLGHTGYTDIPLCWEPSTWSWYVVHEFNHQIDSMMASVGYESFQNPDLPWTLEGAFGENYDYNAFFLRLVDEKSWLKLADSRWGNLILADDQDQDGIPDSGDFPVTEGTFGTSTLNRDSDEDGLDDLSEFIAGIFNNSNPNDPDTDLDGIKDGDDDFPLYPIHPQIINGGNDLFTEMPIFNESTNWILNASTITNPAEFHWLSFGAAYNNSGIEFDVKMPRNTTELTFQLDLNNDGWFHGRDNVELRFYFNNINNKNLTAHVWVADQETIAYFGIPKWDDDPDYLNAFPSIITAADLQYFSWASETNNYLKFWVPWPMQSNDSIRLTVKTRGINDENIWSWIFEENVFIAIQLI